MYVLKHHLVQPIIGIYKIVLGLVERFELYLGAHHGYFKYNIFTHGYFQYKIISTKATEIQAKQQSKDINESNYPDIDENCQKNYELRNTHVIYIKSDTDVGNI